MADPGQIDGPLCGNFWAAIQRKAASRSWLARSVCLLVWGWKAEERLTEAPRAEQRAFQTWKTNFRPHLDTMSTAIPCTREAS